MRKITAIVFAFLCALLLTPRVLADCTLPAGLESIEAQAFYEDLSLKGTLEIPEGVVSIGDEAFLGCTGLTGLVIPPSVTSIGDRAFYGCGNLSGVIYLNSGVSYAASSFTGTKLVLGVKVTGVSLQDTPAFITPGGTARIAATVLPENATIKDLIWESSDTSVLTVSGDGEVTGVAPGQATVTATAADGCGASAFCRVTVLPQLEIISITEDMAVRPGNSITLEAVPAGGTGSYTFRWYYCPDEFSAGVGTYTGNRISLIVGENDETFWYYCVVTSGAQSVVSRRVRITVVSDNIIVSPDSHDGVPAAGGSWQVNVTAAGAWTVSSDSDWLTADRTGGSGSASVTLTASPNTSGAQRQGSVTFTCGSASAVHTVWQTSGGLTVTPDFYGPLSPDIFTLTSFVYADGAWTARSNSSWVTVRPSVGSGNGSISLIGSANNGSEARVATITVTDGRRRAVVTLRQDAWSLDVVPETPETLPASGGAAQIAVSAQYGTWTAQTDASWLTLSASSGEGEGTRITVTADENTSSARSAVVTFSVGNLNKQITINQAGSGESGESGESGSYTPPNVTALSVSLQGDKYIGTPYSVYDCQGFVEKCLSDAGLQKDLAGSNAWYREMTWRGTPEQCVAEFGYIPKGAFLFIVVHDGGEPSSYQDNLGNANHIGIYTGRGKGAIHSSFSKQGVYESYFECATIPGGGWNMVGLWKELDYGNDAVNLYLAGQ